MLKRIADEQLAESRSARTTLLKSPGTLIGELGAVPPGKYLENYARCLLNRQIDVFDDAILLLENERIPSACVISRAMIETQAFALYLDDSLMRTLSQKRGQESVDDCVKIILKFTNSSRLKATEQKKLAKGIFGLGEYKFTEQATHRMTNSLATSEHVMDALRYFFNDEIQQTGKKESETEFVYDGLSEWVHPSQTSIFHNYVPETHMIPTSFGEANLHEFATVLCSKALRFIKYSENNHHRLVDISREISLRST